MPRTPRAPRVTVPVTKEMIQDGIKRDSTHCMISEAVKSAYPDAAYVSTDLQTVRFSDPKKGLRFTYLTPRAAQIFLVNYDQGQEPEPFSFQLRGGQVNSAGKRPPPKALSPAQRKERQESAAKMRSKLKKAKLVDRKKSPGNVPDVVGGNPPPTVPGGNRRVFGLRGFER